MTSSTSPSTGTPTGSRSNWWPGPKASSRRWRTTTPSPNGESTPREAAVARLPSGIRFPKAIRNLLENAVDDDADESEVEVRIRNGDGGTRVHGIDDGPGIPDLERHVFEAGSETPLQHGQGVGLWIAYLQTIEAGGEFDINGSEEGITVTMSFRN